MNKRFGFTLAEVLITAVIIGVIAAIIIPSVIENYQEKVLVNKTKKFYVYINQAVQLAVIEKGTVDKWGLTTDDSSGMLTNIMTYLKYDTFCSSGDTCHTADKLYYSTHLRTQHTTTSQDNILKPSSGYYSLILSDGSVVGTYVYSANCDELFTTDTDTYQLCGEYTVDVNGSAEPNMYGKDIFVFLLTKKDVLPAGIFKPGDTKTDYYPYTSTYGCLQESATGKGCARWVIEKGNMEYLHCTDLTWDDDKCD